MVILKSFFDYFIFGKEYSVKNYCLVLKEDWYVFIENKTVSDMDDIMWEHRYNVLIIFLKLDIRDYYVLKMHIERIYVYDNTVMLLKSFSFKSYILNTYKVIAYYTNRSFI